MSSDKPRTPAKRGASNSSSSRSNKGKKKQTREEEFAWLEEEAKNSWEDHASPSPVVSAAASKKKKSKNNKNNNSSTAAAYMEVEDDKEGTNAAKASKASKKRKKRKKRKSAEGNAEAGDADFDSASATSSPTKKDKHKMDVTDSATASASTNNSSPSKKDKKRSSSKRAKAAAAAAAAREGEDESDDSEADEPPRKKAATASTKKAPPPTTKRSASPKRSTKKAPPAAAAAAAVAPTSPKRKTKKSAADDNNAEGNATPSRKSKRAASASLLDSDLIATPDSNNNNNNEMPMPPPITQLHRTQSTPLELALEHQVVANAKADMAAEPLPFTGPPPAHLLKFAPQEAEEGYDNNLTERNIDTTNNVEGDDIIIRTINEEDEDEEVDNNRLDHPKLEPSFWSVQDVHTVLLVACWSFVAFIVLQSAYRRLIVAPSMTPFQCVQNRVGTQGKYQGICEHMDATSFRDCPSHALCWGGSIHDCRFGGKSNVLEDGPDFFELDPATKECQTTAAVKASVSKTVSILEDWTLAHICRGSSAPAVPSASDTHPYPDAIIGYADGSGTAFVATDVMKEISPENVPFATMDEKDVMHFLDTVVVGDDSLLVLIDMPDLGRQLRKEQAVPAGTRLLGLSAQTGASLQKWWLPLSVQCAMKGMPRGSTPQSGSAVPADDSIKLRKGATIAEEKPTKQKKEEKKKVDAEPMKKEETIKEKVQPEKKQKKGEVKEPTFAEKVKRTFIKPATKQNGTPTAATGNKLAQQSLSAALLATLFSEGFRTWISLIAFIIVLYQYYTQEREKVEIESAWIPEVARLRELALDRIQQATNGGWILTHLQDSVVGAASTVGDDANADAAVIRHQQEHLQHDIWPRVVEQLEGDKRVLQSIVVSNTSGKSQTVLSWQDLGGDDGDDDDDAADAEAIKVDDDKPEERSSRLLAGQTPKKVRPKKKVVI